MLITSAARISSFQPLVNATKRSTKCCDSPSPTRMCRGGGLVFFLSCSFLIGEGPGLLVPRSFVWISQRISTNQDVKCLHRTPPHHNFPFCIKCRLNLPCRPHRRSNGISSSSYMLIFVGCRQERRCQIDQLFWCWQIY